MSETSQVEPEHGHETRQPAGEAGTRVTEFEPEILAFCCEH